MVELLTDLTVIPYLKSRGLIDLNSEPDVEVLTGGVSNIVFAVQQGEHDLVLKQALPELKVQTLWVADQRRAIVEARATKAYHRLTPRHVPRLIDFDPDRFTLVIQRAPRTCTNWKEDLLAGEILIPIASQLGEILGIWHRESAKDGELRNAFLEDSLFDQLRIDPFYRAVADVHESVRPRTEQLIAALQEDKTVLVHGDFSPKNILVDGEDNVIVLDFEVAHTGNPIFDLAFLMGHLLCKFFFYDEVRQGERAFEAARAFLERYEEVVEKEVSSTLYWHIAVIALARVDGVSPVHYLSPQAQIDLRAHMVTLLSYQNPPTLKELFSR